MYDDPATSHCSCNFGYNSIGNTCIAINNCTIANGGCDQNCNYTGPGTSNCSCNAGYVDIGSRCIANACNFNNGGCNQYCKLNAAYGVVCFCSQNYTAVNTSCEAINNCMTNNGGCSDTCAFDGPGSSHCVSSSSSQLIGIIGGAVGGAIGVVLIVVVIKIVFLYRKNRMRRTKVGFSDQHPIVPVPRVDPDIFATEKPLKKFTISDTPIKGAMQGWFLATFKVSQYLNYRSHILYADSIFIHLF